MQSIVVEFETERAIADAMAHIWDKLGTSGELLAQRLPDGHHRLEIISEKRLVPATLEKIGGRQIER